MHLYKTEKLITLKGTIIACLAFLAVVIFCMAATGSLSESVDSHDTETLKNAIDNAVITCYSIEGRYPESIDYLVENYGIVIDKNKYFVDYSIFAPNIKPQVTVLKYKD